MRRTFPILGALLLVAGLALPALAVTQGRVMGEVIDENGDPVPGVKVTVTTPLLTDFEDVYTTNKKGRFTAVFIDATKNYIFKLQKDGYQTLEQPIKPTPGENLKMTFTLPTYAVTVEETTEVPTGAAARGLSPAQRTFNEGVQASQDGDKDTALAKFEEAAGMDPELLHAHLARAGIYLDRKRWEDAAAAAEKVLELDPEDIRAVEIAADAYTGLGDAEKAESYLQRLAQAGINVAARLFNTGVTALNVGDYETAAKKFQQALETDPELTPAYSALAVVLLGLERFEEALEAAQQALQRDPEDDRAKRMRYQALRFLDRSEEAKDAFDSLSESDKGKFVTDLYNEATEAFNAGQTAEAIRILEGVIDADPGYAKAHYLLGLSYTNVGNTGEARTHLQQFLDLSPDDPDAPTAREMLQFLGG